MEQNISINCKVQEDVTYIDSRITVYLGNILADMKSISCYLVDLRRTVAPGSTMEIWNHTMLASFGVVTIVKQPRTTSTLHVEPIDDFQTGILNDRSSEVLRTVCRTGNS